MVNYEIFSPDAIKNISLINKHVVEKRPESFGVDDPSIVTKILKGLTKIFLYRTKKFE